MCVTRQFLHRLNKWRYPEKFGNYFSLFASFHIEKSLLFLHGSSVVDTGLFKLLGINNLFICSIRTTISSVNYTKRARDALKLPVCVIYKNLLGSHSFLGIALSSWFIGWDIYYFGNIAPLKYSTTILEKNSGTSDRHPYLNSFNQREQLPAAYLGSSYSNEMVFCITILLYLMADCSPLGSCDSWAATSCCIQNV